ncbi:DNA topoisomerase IV subunit A [Anaerorhabdus sp.]|uniref:DNA topoisomerase IV subunit A n=1 Tax=Anaerorhabdus sp. TaxID=1872524 RepID=UPI002FC59E6D
MAKKKIEQKKETIFLPMPLEEIMGDRFGRYSKYIIQERALPDARDGLKPVQRRILYAMYNDGNVFERAHRKSAKTVGLVIGNYHPHGDSSVYDAMVRMSQSWKVRVPLIDMHGNNGSIDDDPAAAMRYTEARLSKVSSTMMLDIDKETVEFSPNFDDTIEEPTVLPSRFPTLLVNGATGIASGYATNIPPSNFGEVVEATIYRLQNPECTLEEVMEVIPGPDFPTGGIVQGRKGIEDAFRTGKGRIVVRGKAFIEEGKTINQIIITEIPYEVIKMNLVKKMDDIRISKDIDGILDVRDESDRNGLRIAIDLKKDIDPNLVLNYFYKNTDLQVYYNYNVVAIVEKRPMQLGLLQCLDAFINYRQDVVLRRSHFELNKMETRCHILEGLMKAVSVMDEVIEIIRRSKDKADSKIHLSEAFGFSDAQAEAIVNLRLYRLSSTDIVALREEFARLVNEMEITKTIIENKNVLRSTIVKELKEVRQEYGDDRRTEIQGEVEEIVIDKLSMITNERVMVTVSKDGYVKRVSLRSYTASEGQVTGIKEGDRLIGTLEVDTLDTMLLFTSKGNYGFLPVYQMEEAKWKDVGSHLNNIMKIDADDKIINAIVVKNFETYAWVVTISASGNIKKTPMNQWVVQRNNKVMPAMKLKAKDEMLKAFVVYANQEIVCMSQTGFCTRYDADVVPSTNTKSQGVKSMNFGKEDRLATACVVPDENHSLFVLTEKGSMKRLRTPDITQTSRSVKGEMICKKVKSNPSIVENAVAVVPYDECVFLDPDKQAIQAKDIPLMAKDATFSNPLVFKNGWYYVKGIEECKIVDGPMDQMISMDQSAEVEEKVHDDFEMIDLFED